MSDQVQHKPPEVINPSLVLHHFLTILRKRSHVANSMMAFHNFSTISHEQSEVTNPTFFSVTSHLLHTNNWRLQTLCSFSLMFHSFYTSNLMLQTGYSQFSRMGGGVEEGGRRRSELLCTYMYYVQRVLKVDDLWFPIANSHSPLTFSQ